MRTNSLLVQTENVIGNNISTFIADIDDMIDILEGYDLEAIKKYAYDKYTIYLTALEYNEDSKTITESIRDCIIRLSVVGDSEDKLSCIVYGDDNILIQQVNKDIRKTKIWQDIIEYKSKESYGK